MYKRLVRFAGCVALAVVAAGCLSARAESFSGVSVAGGVGVAAGHGRDHIAERVYLGAVGVSVALAGVAPEPSAVALLGLGILGVAAIVRRRTP